MNIFSMSGKAPDTEKMIFRKDGSQNRYHSEFCNRKESFPLYHIYIEEVLEGLNTETFGSQVLIFEKIPEREKL